jgi:hypothetical protein
MLVKQNTYAVRKAAPPPSDLRIKWLVVEDDEDVQNKTRSTCRTTLDAP